MTDNSCRQVNEVKANRLHPFSHPPLRQCKTLEDGIEIEGQNGNPPPRSIFSKVGRREFASGKTFFQSPVCLLTFSAACIEPMDDFLARPLPDIGNNAEDLVTMVVHFQRLK